MTVICGGGTSSPKPGIAQTIVMSTAAVGALLNNIPTVWAVPLAAYIGLLNYNATSFCSDDPPAVPTITAADIVNLLNVYNPVLGLPAQAKFQQLVSAFAWYQFCKCDSVATPAPPAAPSEPANAPRIDPPSLPPTTVTPCTTIEAAQTRVGFSGSTVYLWGSQTSNPSDANKRRIDPGATLLKWTVTCDVRPADTVPVDVVLNAYADGPFNSATVGHLTFTFQDGPAPITKTQQVAWPADKPLTDCSFSSFTTSYAIPIKAHAEWYCGATPLTPAAPCCPPDPQVLAKVEQILGYVTLIQRQIAPFAFIDGPAHPGLQNFGQLLITEPIVGVRVELTTIPAALGLSQGNPDFHFDCGYVSLGDADGWFGERRLGTAETVWQPRWAGAVTRIGYTLHPGVTATITELRREP